MNGNKKDGIYDQSVMKDSLLKIGPRASTILGKFQFLVWIIIN